MIKIRLNGLGQSDVWLSDYIIEHKRITNLTQLETQNVHSSKINIHIKINKKNYISISLCVIFFISLC